MYHYKLGCDQNHANYVVDLLHVERYTQEAFDNIVFQASLAIAERHKNAQEELFFEQQDQFKERLKEAISLNDKYLIDWYQMLSERGLHIDITFSQMLRDIAEHMVEHYEFRIAEIQAGCWVFGNDNIANPKDEFSQREQDLFLKALVAIFQSRIHVNGEDSGEMLIYDPSSPHDWQTVAEHLMKRQKATDITNKEPEQ